MCVEDSEKRKISILFCVDKLTGELLMALNGQSTLIQLYSMIPLIYSVKRLIDDSGPHKWINIDEKYDPNQRSDSIEVGAFQATLLQSVESRHQNQRLRI